MPADRPRIRLSTSGLPERLLVGPWPDPVVETAGVDPRSRYVERFWLPVLGPSATFLLRRLADDLAEHPEGFALDVAAAASGLGLNPALGPRSPMGRAFGRLGRFGVLRPARPGIAVRRALSTLPRRLVVRLPPLLHDEHEQWVASRAPTRRGDRGGPPTLTGLLIEPLGGLSSPGTSRGTR
jgi:hypothetical protein